jgi:hypothetical protein
MADDSRHQPVFVSQVIGEGIAPLHANTIDDRAYLGLQCNLLLFLSG